MYRFHGWFRLVDPVEDGFDQEAVGELEQIVAGFAASVNTVAEMKSLNGEYHLWIHGYTNRRRFPGEAATVDAVLDFVGKRFPTAFGIMYELDDEMVEPPGGNAFRVRVVARGTVTERQDPFLSPYVPTIEN